MKSTTSTKKALLLAILSTLLCVSMLIGTTFAWFTDTASTAVNKIVSGELDVSLEMRDGDKWVSAEGVTLNFQAATGTTNILWEPGCTYNLPELRVVNNGNLALKYKIAVTGLKGSSKLLKVIDWYYNDAEISADTGMAVSDDVVLNAYAKGDPFVIKAHMDETTGNEYQNQTIEGIGITVYATQATVENDSNGNQYDAGAEYAYVNTEAELKEALNEGKNIIFNGEMKLTEQLRITKNVTINGNGNALISAKPIQIAPEANVTISNVSFADPVNHSPSYGDRDVGSNIYVGTNSVYYTGKLVLDGCNFSGMKWDGVQVLAADGAEVVINNCNFELTSEAPADNKTRFIHIQAVDNSNANVKVTITNNFFGASTYIREALIDIDYINIAGIDFGGNNVYTDTEADIYVCGASVSRTITKEDAYKALGVQQVNVSSAADLQEAMTAGKEYVKLTSDITIEDSMTFTGKTLIDGDGNTIVMNKRNAFRDGANVTFRNCTVKVNAANTSIYNSTVEFAEDTVLDSSAPAYTAAIWAYGGATLIFRGKLISSVPNAYGICVNTDATTNKAPNTVELIGADITTNGGATVYVNGSVGGHTLKITDCKITNTAPDCQALYISNSATAEKQHVTIENCEISGGTAIEVKHTDLTIKNSTLTAIGDPTQYAENNNGATAIGYCLATTSNSKSGVIDLTTGTITIENCTFVSTVSGCEVFNSSATAEGNAGAVINGYDQTKVLYPAKLTPNA